jgi:ribosomal protein S8
MLARLISNFNLSISHKRSSFMVKDNKSIRIVLDVMWDEKLIIGYRTEDKKLKVLLKYTVWGKTVLKHICLLSKPGRRQYVAYFELADLLKNNRIYFLSTDRGLMSANKAKILGIGGELLFYINY